MLQRTKFFHFIDTGVIKIANHDDLKERICKFGLEKNKAKKWKILVHNEGRFVILPPR